MSAKIHHHLITVYPDLAPILTRCAPIAPIEQSDERVLNLLVKIIIGQMLSRKAAETIYNRVSDLISKKGNLENLTIDDFMCCGVSKRKAQSIRSLVKYNQNNPDLLESWRTLSYDDLLLAVNEHKGISNWTAAMLAIFYFGHNDVFPYEDGTIKRVMTLLVEMGISIDPSISSPYRSYLALYLWQMIDEGFI